MAGRKRKADASLVLALACGASPESAAQRTGLSLRTVYRRLAEPAFCAQVMDLRLEMTRRLAGMLTAAGVGSVKTFTTLRKLRRLQYVDPASQYGRRFPEPAARAASVA